MHYKREPRTRSTKFWSTYGIYLLCTRLFISMSMCSVLNRAPFLGVKSACLLIPKYLNKHTSFLYCIASVTGGNEQVASTNSIDSLICIIHDSINKMYK